jgi:hypothetical protein
VPRLKAGHAASEQIEIFALFPVGDAGKEPVDLGLLNGKKTADEILPNADAKTSSHRNSVSASRRCVGSRFCPES